MPLAEASKVTACPRLTIMAGAVASLVSSSPGVSGCRATLWESSVLLRIQRLLMPGTSRCSLMKSVTLSAAPRAIGTRATSTVCRTAMSTEMLTDHCSGSQLTRTIVRVTPARRGATRVVSGAGHRANRRRGSSAVGLTKTSLSRSGRATVARAARAASAVSSLVSRVVPAPSECCARADGCAAQKAAHIKSGKVSKQRRIKEVTASCVPWWRRSSFGARGR
jgi:hypothetical protein